MMFDDDSHNSEDGDDGGGADGDRHGTHADEQIIFALYFHIPNISPSMLHDLNVIYFILPTIFTVVLQNLRVLIAFSWSRSCLGTEQNRKGESDSIFMTVH